MYQFWEVPLPQGTALPRYVQIAEALIRDIAAGRIADSARLPPERVLAAAQGCPWAPCARRWTGWLRTG